MKWLIRSVIAVAVLAVAGYFAADYILSGGMAAVADPIEIGKEMPNFEMEDYTGKKHTLEQYKGKIVVLEFCSQHCPFSRGTDPHISALAKKYAEKDVVFLGIDSHKATPPEDIKKHAEENNIPFPILKDEGNKYADAVGARVTPEMYIVDKDGKLAYHGAYDDRSGPEGPGDTAFAANAIEALLKGETPDPQREKAWGCGIKRVG